MLCLVHAPVLLKEVIEYLDPKPGGKFIDATLDGGGHAIAILERIGLNGRLLGIEWDNQLLEQLKLKIKDSEYNNRAVLLNNSYVNLKSIAEENDFISVDGVLFDLGMSSWHLEESGRGFTFQKDEPLDMRFSHKSETQNFITAEEIVNNWPYAELAKTIRECGGEQFAGKIAALITKERKEKRIKTTFQLVELVKRAVPFWYRYGRRIHYATKTFQALRMAVNGELGNIRDGLAGALAVLRSGGRIVVISFHSAEDRLVKNFFKESKEAGHARIITAKPVVPTQTEIDENFRSRSAKLRVAEKISSAPVS